MIYDRAEIENLRCWSTLSGSMQCREFTTSGQRTILVGFAGVVMDYAIWCNALLSTLGNRYTFRDIMLRNKNAIELQDLNPDWPDIQSLDHVATLETLLLWLSARFRALSDEQLNQLLESSLP